MDRMPNQNILFAYPATSMLEPFPKTQPSKYKQFNRACALSKKAGASTTNESQKQMKAQRNKVSKIKIKQFRMSSPKPKTNVFFTAARHETQKICNVNASH
jgi:hypothetical protein